MSVDSCMGAHTLASGFLSGKYREASDLDKSQRGGGVKRYLSDPRGQAILKALDDVVKRHEVQPAAVAIAWTITNPLVTAPIASATKSSHLDALIKRPVCG